MGAPAGLSESAILAWYKHEMAGRALAKVLAVLEPAGIEVLPVKGVILGRTLYADVSERPISDVDLRLRPRDLSHARRLLGASFAPILHQSKQWGTFEIEVEKTLVEVETSVGPPGLSRVSIDAMIARATRTDRGLGFPHLEPELHDHALLLCVTSFKDKFVESLPWSLGDLPRIAAEAAFDPARMAALAREARLETVVAITAEWVEEHGGSTGWRAVREILGERRRPLYARAFQSMVRSLEAGGRRSQLALPLLARMASDDPASRLRALALGGLGTLSWWWDDRRAR